MKFFKKVKADRVALEEEGKDDFDYDRDFQKERAERQVWRPPPFDIFFDLP